MELELWKKVKRISIGVIIVVFLTIITIGSIFVVDEGERGVLLTFGQISQICEPGVHFKVPFIQSTKFFNVKVRNVKFSNLTAYSFDQQIVEGYDISIIWNYDVTKMAEIYSKFGAETHEGENIFSTVVMPKVQEISKMIFGRYTAQTAIQERGKLNSALSEEIINALRDYPIHIVSIQLEEVNFSDSYESIVEQTAQAKQAIEKQKNELARVDIEAKQKIAQADAENKAMKLKAEAEAYQIETVAKAEANAIRMRGEALKENPRLVDLTIAEKWNGTVPGVLMQNDDKKSATFPLLNITSQQ